MAPNVSRRVGRAAICVLVVAILAVALGLQPRRIVKAGNQQPATADVRFSASSSEGVDIRLGGDVSVRMIDASGAPQASHEVRADFVGPKGRLVLEVSGLSNESGQVVFPDLAVLAAQFESGTRMLLRFDDLGAEHLAFNANAIPKRELTLVHDSSWHASSEQRLPDLNTPLPSSVEVLPLDSHPVASPTILTVIASAIPSETSVTSSQNAMAYGLGAVGEVLPVLVPVLVEGRLGGQVLVDPGVPFFELRLELDEVLPGQPDRVGRRLGPLSPDSQGGFHFDGVAPGLCALRVSLWGSQRTLLWIDEINVLPGEVLHDERLDALDLRGRLRSIEVEIFDLVGRELELAVVAPLDRHSGARGRLRVQSRGSSPRIWFDRRSLDGVGGLDLQLEAPGFAPRAVHVQPEDLAKGKAMRFALEPSVARQLELRLIAPLPNGVRVEARLARLDGQTRPWDVDKHRGQLNRGGRVRLAPAETGAFVVRLYKLGEGAPRDLGLLVPVLVVAEETASQLTDGANKEARKSVDVDVLYLPLDLNSL